jgi:hypothetical protein
VDVNVQVQRATEALDQRYHAALRRIPRHAGLIGKPAGDHALHDAEHRADGIRFAGEQEAKVYRPFLPSPAAMDRILETMHWVQWLDEE